MPRHPVTPLLALLPLLLASTALAADFPPTPAKPVTDTYHGVNVVDPYRWLEDGTDPAVQAWSDAQNAATRRMFETLPNVDALRVRLTEILSAQTTSHFGLVSAGGRLFAERRQPPKQQPFLIVMDSATAPESARVIVDPGTMNAKGTTAIDWYVPSPDGKLVAVSLSEGGSESGDLTIFDVATGQPVFEKIPRVQNGTGGGSVAWLPDGKSFLYTRYPRGAERPPEDAGFYMQLYRHVLGTPTEQDAYEIGRDFPKIAELQVETTPEGLAFLSLANGDGGEYAHYGRTLDGRWHQITRFADRVVWLEPGRATGGSTTTLYLDSRKGAPRGQVLALPFHHQKGATLDQARVLIPEAAEAIRSFFYYPLENMLATDGRLYVPYQTGGPNELRVFDLEGRRQSGPEQFPVSSVGELVRLGERGDTMLFANTSYLEPRAWQFFDPAARRTTRTPLSSIAAVTYADCETVREFATSQDGTKIPVNIVRRKGLKLDGSHPCVLTGYGGYNASMSPAFSAPRRILLDQGFVFAEANLRGGSEFGDEWHAQGMLTKKQNVFDDFAAACRHLVAAGYTSREKLAIQGGSNGGLLMGAALTQHPELVRCVVSHVGIYDMLRTELSTNGSFNISEYGTVKDEAQFKALYAYSPYHHVRDGVKYPPVLFSTGANDPRVEPMQSRKMTARLQAAGATAWLRTDANAGHGLDSSLQQRIEREVEVAAFLFAQLGLQYRAPAK